MSRHILTLLPFIILLHVPLLYQKKPLAHPYYAYHDEYGQFYVETKINNIPITLMVDTGASDISISEEAATRLRLPQGGKSVEYSMADNSTHTCRAVNAKTVAVGSNVATNISLSVCKDSIGLLGMGYLSKVNTNISDGILEITSN